MKPDIEEFMREIGMSKFDIFMWRATNFMIWRYSRFIMLGFSFSASFFTAFYGVYCFNDGLFWQGTVGVVLSLVDFLMFLYVGNKYRKEFWT